MRDRLRLRGAWDLGRATLPCDRRALRRSNDDHHQHDHYNHHASADNDYHDHNYYHDYHHYNYIYIDDQHDNLLPAVRCSGWTGCLEMRRWSLQHIQQRIFF
jgi:hypothetical protein